MAAALIAASATGCGGGASGDDASGPLRVVASPAPSNLDPPKAADIQSSVLGNVYVQLTRFGTVANTDGTLRLDQSEVLPYLAERWESSDDLRTWRFTIKPGLAFASGEPVDAKAVEYSLNRALDDPGGQYFITNNNLGNVISIKATSDDEVVIRLKQGDPNIPNVMALPYASIVDPSVVRNKPERWLASHEAGSGPWKIAEYQPNRRLVLREREGFAEWHGEAPASEEIEVEYVADESAMLLRVRSGNADVAMGLTKQSAASLEGTEGLRIVSSQTSNSEQVLLPWDKEPWDDPRLREAAALAVPYEGIVEHVAKGYAETFFGPLNPGLRHFNPDIAPPLEPDVERAKRLIAESDLETPVPVKLTIEQGNPTHREIATLIQDAWKQVGFDVTVDVQPVAAYNDGLFSGKLQAALRLDGPALLDPGYYLSYDMKCGVLSPTRICIPAADELLEAARRSPDEDANQRRYDEITMLWRERFPKITLYNDHDVTVLSDEVEQWRYGNPFALFEGWSK